MKIKEFQAPVLFSSTFKALNLGKKSSTFKDFQGCVGTLHTSTDARGAVRVSGPQVSKGDQTRLQFFVFVLYSSCYYL